jgi:parallel beta-helix repeat protein
MPGVCPSRGAKSDGQSGPNQIAKLRDSWYVTTAQYAVSVPVPSPSAISQFQTCISEAGSGLVCVLPAGVYALDRPATGGDVGAFHIARSDVTVRGEDTYDVFPYAIPVIRTKLWRRSGCAPLLSVKAGVKNVVIERMTFDGNNDTLANTCFEGNFPQPNRANDLFIQGSSSGPETFNIKLQRLYFQDAVGRALTIAGAQIRKVTVVDSFFVNAALTGALVLGPGEGALTQPVAGDPNGAYRCDQIPSATESTAEARSVPRSVSFESSYFANSWTGAIAFNSVFDPQISTSRFYFNYFNPYDNAGGTIFLDRCAAIGSVTNSLFEGTGLTTNTEGLEIHGARMLVQGNTFNGYPQGGIVLHSSRNTTVTGNVILDSGIVLPGGEVLRDDVNTWPQSSGLTVSNRYYGMSNGTSIGRATGNISIVANTITNSGTVAAQQRQRYGVRFAGCLDDNQPECSTRTFGTASSPIILEASNILNNNRTAPACINPNLTPGQFMILAQLPPPPPVSLGFPPCQP